MLAMQWCKDDKHIILRASYNFLRMFSVIKLIKKNINTVSNMFTKIAQTGKITHHCCKGMQKCIINARPLILASKTLESR